ncbi:type II toxin-antitoxin system RelB/DinJ family antitoxin [Xanthobacteraceae bacterium A53D]
MAPTPSVRAQTDKPADTDAEAVLDDLALPLSDALRFSLTLVARDKAPPLDFKTPDAAALAAIAATHARMAARQSAGAGGTGPAPKQTPGDKA